MEQLCKNSCCKKKLQEYRDLTTKLYDDIYTLESDLKEKDGFVQHVVKGRNDFQKEVEVLKKKNSALMRENNDLLEKNEQLDEDAETGLQFVRNAQDRERKVFSELNECKEALKRDSGKIDAIEAENEDLKFKLVGVKNKFEKCLRENQEKFASKETKIKELENELIEHEEKKAKNYVNNACFDFEGVVNEKMANIEALEKENKELKQRNDDLSDELQVKRREMKDLENMHENDELKNMKS